MAVIVLSVDRGQDVGRADRGLAADRRGAIGQRTEAAAEGTARARHERAIAAQKLKPLPGLMLAR
jgi:hypothetical protein